MSDPSISVAMSVYNCAAYLGAAIESVLRQSFGDFEFLILNDGSTDASRAIIDHYAAADPRIRAIHRDNKGLIASLNELIGLARAPLIARMDGDDICLPERFAKQLAFLDGHPDHGVVGTWTRDIAADGSPYHLTGKDHPTTHEAAIAAIGHHSLLCHPATMYRRDVVRAVGGYHAAFRHCEDFDLWLRLIDRTRIASIPERLLLYRHTDGQISTRHAVEQQINAAVSVIAWEERAAGRPDPTEHLAAMPTLDALDSLFGRPGIADRVLARVVPSLIFSHVAMRGDGFDLVQHYLKNGGNPAGMWRTVARLSIRMGEWRRAGRLAQTLLRPTKGVSVR